MPALAGPRPRRAELHDRTPLGQPGPAVAMRRAGQSSRRDASPHRNQVASYAAPGGAGDGRWLYFRAALRSGQIGKAPDSGSGDCRFESCLLSQRFFAKRARAVGGARRWSHRLVVRTPASHVGNAGSTPAGIIQVKGLDSWTRIDLLPPVLTLCWQRV